MSHKTAVPIIIFLALILFGCNLVNSTTPSPALVNTPGNPPAATVIPITAPAPSATPMPTATATLSLSDTPMPTASDTAVIVPVPASNNYIDDRSTPSQVIVSLYNAINRKEYLRAYNYWDDPATLLGGFNSYAAGYQDTASVDLVFGQITGDAGMSQYFYTVPVILKATSKSNARTNYAACYVVHASKPDVYGAPPFYPMGINQGSAKPSNLNTNDGVALASACAGYPVGLSNPVPVSGATLNIDKDNFLDNRSGPIETVSSFLNALNLKQYVRAYYYYQDPATYPGPYTAYAAGYADTEVITVTFGTVQSEGAAGSLYYKVPTALHVLTTTSSKQTFVGCYTLRLGQPAVQGTPPFQPMGIISGKFNQVANNANVNSLLPTACN
jgi:hypothetical protein